MLSNIIIIIIINEKKMIGFKIWLFFLMILKLNVFIMVLNSVLMVEIKEWYLGSIVLNIV